MRHHLLLGLSAALWLSAVAATQAAVYDEHGRRIATEHTPPPSLDAGYDVGSEHVEREVGQRDYGVEKVDSTWQWIRRVLFGDDGSVRIE